MFSGVNVALTKKLSDVRVAVTEYVRLLVVGIALRDAVSEDSYDWLGTAVALAKQKVPLMVYPCGLCAWLDSGAESGTESGTEGAASTEHE